MSTNTDLRKGDVRIAIGNLLHTEWNPANAGGYDPTLPESDNAHLDIHLGLYEEDSDFPQLGLRDVSSIPTGSAGYSAIKATGAGPIQTFRGRIDAGVYVGASGAQAANPQLLAKRIGLEAREIIHDNANGVMDPVTGTLLATNLACSRPRVGVDPDLAEAHYIGRLEITYELSEDPPERV